MQANIITSIGVFYNVDRFVINQGQQFQIELQEAENVVINVGSGSWTTNNDRVLSVEEINDAISANIKAENTGKCTIRVLAKDSDSIIKKIEVEVASQEALNLKATVVKTPKEN